MNAKTREHMRAAGVMSAGAAAFLETLSRQPVQCFRPIRRDRGKWYCDRCDFRPSGFMGGPLPYCETRDTTPPPGDRCPNLIPRGS